MQNMVNQETQNQMKIEKEKKTKEKESRPLVNDPIFSSKLREEMMVLFSDESYPTHVVHSFIPFITYMRNILISLSLFICKSNPYVQVAIILMIEIAYMMVIILYSNKMDVWDNSIDMFNCITNCIYLVLKFITIFGIDDDTRQTYYGKIMVIVLVVNFVGNMVYVVYSICMILIDNVKPLVKRYKLKKEEKKICDMNSKWKETLVYEFTVQPQAGNGQRVPTPIIVEEPQDVFHGVPLNMPQPKRISIPVKKKNGLLRAGINVKQNREGMMDDFIEERDMNSNKREDDRMEVRDASPKKVIDDIIVENFSDDELRMNDRIKKKNAENTLNKEVVRKNASTEKKVVGKRFEKEEEMAENEPPNAVKSVEKKGN